MVAGHGVDVLDVDTKAGGSVNHLPVGIETFGEVTTPSSGAHLYVRSTGFAKIGNWETSAGFVGDYAGGTVDGGGRLLVYLPGSTRWKPEYRGKGYRWTVPLDLQRLLEAEPDDSLLSTLMASGGSLNGKPGVPAAGRAEIDTFLAAHESQPTCMYGRKAVEGLLGRFGGSGQGRSTRVVRALDEPRGGADEGRVLRC